MRRIKSSEHCEKIGELQYTGRVDTIDIEKWPYTFWFKKVSSVAKIPDRAKVVEMVIWLRLTTKSKKSFDSLFKENEDSLAKKAIKISSALSEEYKLGFVPEKAVTKTPLFILGRGSYAKIYYTVTKKDSKNIS